MTDAQIQKFWSLVPKKTESECWEFLGNIAPNGYGRMRFMGKYVYAHRIMYFLTHDEWAPCLDHLCRNRKCCNPAHLESVPKGVNALRGEGIFAQNFRKTHCKRGHPLEGDNLRLVKKGRQCATCMRLSGRKFMAKWRAAHPDLARDAVRRCLEKKRREQQRADCDPPAQLCGDVAVSR